MIPPFDIFSVQGNGELLWEAMAESLEVARLRVKRLMDAQPAEYVICSKKTGHKMAIKPDGSITAFPPRKEDR